MIFVLNNKLNVAFYGIHVESTVLDITICDIRLEYIV